MAKSLRTEYLKQYELSKNIRLQLVGLVICGVGSGLMGCAGSTSGSASAPFSDEESQISVNTGAPGSSSTASQLKAPVDLNKMLPHNAICTPWPKDGEGDWQNGLKGSVFYRAQGQDRWYNSLDYINKGTPKSGTILVSSLNVPTRMFTEGFETAAGESIKNEMGEKLIEYFGLSFESDLVLTENDEEGEYEFSSLTDDGFRLSIQDGNGVWQDVITTEGDHPTKMGCSSKRILLEKNKLYPMRVTYYQGPRYHISLVAMWRKAPVGPLALDPSCNKQGNELYFDPNKDSVPKAAYNDLLSRGWSPIASQNFVLGAYKAINICTDEPGPTIIDFLLSEYSDTEFTFLWETNEPATTQLKITNVATQETFVTQTSNVLETTHFATVSGLKANTSYLVQPVSVNENVGLTIGEGIVIQTK